MHPSSLKFVWIIGNLEGEKEEIGGEWKGGEKKNQFPKLFFIV